MCHRNPCHDVLFPCEHKCVCRSCLQTNGIGESREEGKWPLCPLCCQEIKRILPSDGREVEKYWNWVLEVEPRLPPKFAQRFEFAGAYLTEPRRPPWTLCVRDLVIRRLRGAAGFFCSRTVVAPRRL